MHLKRYEETWMGEENQVEEEGAEEQSKCYFVFVI